MQADATKITAFQDRLLAWYRKGRRRFAWRSPSTSAYAILLSELMLRKTGTATVAQEYEPFVERYPSPEYLAAAAASDIALSIRRLGIADRGRLLKSLGEQLVTEYAGEVPRTMSQLMALPGVGRYTASAVLCFAYQQAVAILDTNAIRVLDRVFSIRSAMTRPHLDGTLWSAATELVPPSRPVAYNRALLDFAAVVCTHRHPRCGVCPISTICDFYRTQSTESTAQPQPVT